MVSQVYRSDTTPTYLTAGGTVYVCGIFSLGESLHIYRVATNPTSSDEDSTLSKFVHHAYVRSKWTPISTK